MWVCQELLQINSFVNVIICVHQVVQDFVQATVEAESPREWLLSLMDTSSRESEYDINLLGQSSQ